ncbi:MAG TPA: hypothetical protein PLI77_08155, partial [Bacteroidales bacterium]|nr:hypothetical protein [Bacteroidales bacterium]
MINKFINQWHSFFQNRKPVFFIGLSGLILLLFLIASQIKLHEDISGFLPVSNETELINFVYENNKISDKI